MFKTTISTYDFLKQFLDDEIELTTLAQYVFENRPEQGYLTISPALQWRLQYSRVQSEAGIVDGVHSVYKGKKL